MTKENYEMQFLELMASLTAQTPDTADAPPVEAVPEPQVEPNVMELLGIQPTPDLSVQAAVLELLNGPEAVNFVPGEPEPAELVGIPTGEAPAWLAGAPEAAAVPVVEAAKTLSSFEDRVARFRAARR
jgi:hypothetical protein